MTTNQKRGVWVIVLGIGIAIISLLTKVLYES